MRSGFLLGCIIVCIAGCAGTAPDEGRKSAAKGDSTRPLEAIQAQLRTSEDSLREAILQLSRSLLHPEAKGEWRADTAVARAIQRRKSDLATLVEDANWILALAAALEGPLPEDVKLRLRRLHESYAVNLPDSGIYRQVNDLLPRVTSEKLRKEMKKLANRSWDRNKRAGIASDTIATPPPPIPILPKPDSLSVVEPVVPVKSDSSFTPALQDGRERFDTLVSQGQYLKASRLLESMEGQADEKWIQDRRTSLGNRYCEDRRTTAAAAFLAARRTSINANRIQFLRQSLSSLDSCLSEFPDAPTASKVRRNRAMVEKELSR